MNTRIPAGRGNPPKKEPPIDSNKKVKDGVEATITQPRTHLEIQLNDGEITQNKQLNKSKREASKPCTHTKESASTQPAHTCTTEYKRWWME